MYGNSYEYSTPQRQPYSYGLNRYSSQPTGYPSITPYSYSNYTNSPPLNMQPYRPQGYENYSQPQSKGISNNNPNQSSNQNNSFVNSFDNNKSGLLNQNKSHARNITGRLLYNVDQDVEREKQEKLQQYREELKRQIQETQMRKKAEKQKIQKEEMERMRKFYEGFKIKAQVKDRDDQPKNDQGGFLGRTIYKMKKAQIQKKQEIAAPAQPSSPPMPHKVVIKARGKSYLNKSSLDNFGQSSFVDNYTTNNNQNIQNEEVQSPLAESRKISRVEEEIIRERAVEEERISKLLLFQQRLLQKISDIKVQIKNTSLSLDSQNELQKIRNNLRAKPIPFTQNMQNSFFRQNRVSPDFYSLPKITKLQSIPPITHYSINLRNKQEIKNPETKLQQKSSLNLISTNKSIQQEEFIQKQSSKHEQNNEEVGGVNEEQNEKESEKQAQQQN